ncbi:MAG: hypothetical protein DRP01_08870 [Archaeoglobales archaeon]|nr:MAG: hypothetical protein DRP01_08870 [Archaeoglobales archaeon]
MGQRRGFATLVRILHMFFRMHGYLIRGTNPFDVMLGTRPLARIHIGHWHQLKPHYVPYKEIAWMVTEGRIPRYKKPVLRDFTYLVGTSKYVKRKCEEIDLQCLVIYPGVNTDFFKPMDVPKLYDVVSVGIHEGSNDDRKFMKYVQRVCFPFSVHIQSRSTAPVEALPLLYNYARVYLSLSACEGFNLPALEAMACGIPVVFNDAPATNEFAVGIAVPPKEVREVIVGGSTRLYFEWHVPDLQAIRTALHDLLRSQKKIQQLSRQARAKAQQMDFRKTLSEFLELIR